MLLVFWFLTEETLSFSWLQLQLEIFLLQTGEWSCGRRYLSTSRRKCMMSTELTSSILIQAQILKTPEALYRVAQGRLRERTGCMERASLDTHFNTCFLLLCLSRLTCSSLNCLLLPLRQKFCLGLTGRMLLLSPHRPSQV